jgi:hypothetical protein
MRPHHVKSVFGLVGDSAGDRAANRLSFLAAMRRVMMVNSAEVFPDPSEPMTITLFVGPDHMPVASIGHGILEVMALFAA